MTTEELLQQIVKKLETLATKKEVATLASKADLEALATKVETLATKKELEALDAKVENGFKLLHEKLEIEITDIAHFQSSLDQVVEDHKNRIEELEDILKISKN